MREEWRRFEIAVEDGRMEVTQKDCRDDSGSAEFGEYELGVNFSLPSLPITYVMSLSARLN